MLLWVRLGDCEGWPGYIPLGIQMHARTRAVAWRSKPPSIALLRRKLAAAQERWKIGRWGRGWRISTFPHVVQRGAIGDDNCAVQIALPVIDPPPRVADTLIPVDLDGALAWAPVVGTDW
jgi:hypothetical protein